MLKEKSVRSFFLRTALKLLLMEAATLLLAWLLYRWWNWVQRFSDILFLVGILQIMAASVGMLGRPYEVSNSPWGVPRLPVQDSEQEQRWQAVATLIAQRSFALGMIVCGVLSIILSTIFTYVLHY